MHTPSYYDSLQVRRAGWWLAGHSASVAGVWLTFRGQIRRQTEMRLWRTFGSSVYWNQGLSISISSVLVAVALWHHRLLLLLEPEGHRRNIKLSDRRAGERQRKGSAVLLRILQPRWPRQPSCVLGELARASSSRLHRMTSHVMIVGFSSCGLL